MGFMDFVENLKVPRIPLLRQNAYYLGYLLINTLIFLVSHLLFPMATGIWSWSSGSPILELFSCSAYILLCYVPFVVFAMDIVENTIHRKQLVLVYHIWTSIYSQYQIYALLDRSITLYFTDTAQFVFTVVTLCLVIMAAVFHYVVICWVVKTTDSSTMITWFPNTTYWVYRFVDIITDVIVVCLPMVVNIYSTVYSGYWEITGYVYLLLYCMLYFAFYALYNVFPTIATVSLMHNVSSVILLSGIIANTWISLMRGFVLTSPYPVADGLNALFKAITFPASDQWVQIAAGVYSVMFLLIILGYRIIVVAEYVLYLSAECCYDQGMDGPGAVLASRDFGSRKEIGGGGGEGGEAGGEGSNVESGIKVVDESTGFWRMIFHV